MKLSANRLREHYLKWFYKNRFEEGSYISHYIWKDSVLVGCVLHSPPKSKAARGESFFYTFVIAGMQVIHTTEELPHTCHFNELVVSSYNNKLSHGQSSSYYSVLEDLTTRPTYFRTRQQ